jgi:uncharacterized protein (DUF1501 family)
MKRRSFLSALAGHPLKSAVGAAGLLGALNIPGVAAAGDYRALVCVFLTGGNDGNNALVPTDGAYLDYNRARSDLALPKASLVNLSGSSAGHSFGVNAALAPLASLYNQQRLAWIANVGALVEPATAQQVKNRTVQVPPFLFSHSDQQSYTQGWMGDEDASGWAGRGIELFPSALKNALQAVTNNTNKTLVLGRQSRVAFMDDGGGARYWGNANLANPESAWSQTLNRMAQWQFSNQYEAEYARSLGGSVTESTLFTQALLRATPPQATFSDDSLSSTLRSLASVLPVFKAMGFRRQVFQINWGNFDTHTEQRGVGMSTQDTQLATLANALAAFDRANQAAGLNLDVTTLAMSEFGRTLRPASGGGSDHAWGSHWLTLGGAVAGGQVLGQLPSLVLGGVDDADSQPGGGRFVPTTSADQVGASMMQWLGLPSASLTTVFPNLKNFTQKSLRLLAT